MKRKLLSVILVLTMLLCLSACGCEHQWIDADCDHPMMCSLCAETQGEPLGHSWVEVSCTEPKHCAHCDAAEGEPLGHTWQEATCTDAQKCTACGQIQGEALGHTWEEATTEAPQTCTVCQATEGAKLDTDARFTTAATKQLQGKWAGDFMLPGDLIGTTGYLDQLECTVYYEFGNAGAYSLYIQLKDEDAFEEAMLQMIIDVSYAALTESGISQEEAYSSVVIP